VTSGCRELPTQKSQFSMSWEEADDGLALRLRWYLGLLA
jgi:hypothetical protein